MNSEALPVLSYDPRLSGARCDLCALGPTSPLVRYGPERPWRPVPSEFNPGALGFMIGQSPGPDEHEGGRPWIGRAGLFLTQMVNALGLPRGAFSYSNVALCSPPGVATGAYERILYRTHKHNAEERRKAKTEGRDPVLILEPHVACLPRLKEEILRYDNLVLLGGDALKVFYGDEAGITDLRGGQELLGLGESGKFYRGRNIGQLQLVKTWKVIPLFHPSYVLQARRWQRVFRSDIAKALRYFRGQLNWTEPLKVFRPSPAQFRAFLGQGHRALTIDWETPLGKHPGTGKKLKYAEPLLIDHARCIGVGNSKVVFVIPFVSIDGFTRFYSTTEEAEMVELLRWLMTNPAIWKYGWNHTLFDSLLSEQPRILGVPIAPMLDGILLDHIENPEWFHSLAFVGSLKTDAPAWKADDTALTASTDSELWEYNASDCAVTHVCVEDSYRRVHEMQQGHLIAHDHRMQGLCQELHKGGLYVDQEMRRSLTQKYRLEEERWAKTCRDIAGDIDLNPASPVQVSELLYEKWGIDIPTDPRGREMRSPKTDEPSTAEEALIELFKNPRLSEEERRFVRALRKVRKGQKKRGFLDAARPFSEGGYTFPDGRLRSTYKGHVTPSGRLASGDPVNLQNQVKFLRRIYRAAPGHALVLADKDQVELRVGASLAGAKFYLNGFQDPKFDPHSVLAELAYGDRFLNAPGDKKTGMKGRLRDNCKRIQYSSLFAALIEMVHELVRSGEDQFEELAFYDQELRETQLIYDAWRQLAPEFPVMWDNIQDFWRLNGYVTTPILDRRRPSLDSIVGDEELSEMVAHPIQGGTADAVNLEALELRDAFPFECWGPGTGLIAHTHDELIVECPVDEAPRVQGTMHEIMNSRYPGLPGVQLTAEAETHWRWTEDTCDFVWRDGAEVKVCGKYREPEIRKWRPKAELCMGHA